MDLPKGTVGALLIENIWAAVEMDEILGNCATHSRALKLRPLGLHLQLPQEIRERLRIRVFLLPDRRAGHDDHACPGR